MEISWNPSKCLPNMRFHSETPSCIPLAPNYKCVLSWMGTTNFYQPQAGLRTWLDAARLAVKGSQCHHYTQAMWNLKSQHPINMRPAFSSFSEASYVSLPAPVDWTIWWNLQSKIESSSCHSLQQEANGTKDFFHDLSPRIREHARMASPLPQESRSWRYSSVLLFCFIICSALDRRNSLQQQLCCSDRTDSISWLSVLPDAPCDTFKNLIDVIINFQLLQLRLRQCSTSHCSVLDAPR